MVADSQIIADEAEKPNRSVLISNPISNLISKPQSRENMVLVAALSQDSVNGWHSFGPWYLVISLLPSCPRAYRASTPQKHDLSLETWKCARFSRHWTLKKFEDSILKLIMIDMNSCRINCFQIFVGYGDVLSVWKDVYVICCNQLYNCLLFEIIRRNKNCLIS